MSTLNAGFGLIRDIKMTDEDNDLVSEWLKTNEVKKIQPAAAGSNEQSRSTQQLIAQRRREFRKKAKEQTSN